MNVPVYILAGGRSTRFGSDKARANADGQPLLQRLATSVAPIASSLTVVADVAGKYADLGLRTIADLDPGCGPMSGLQAALADCPEPWLLLLSCDLVTVQPVWIDQLTAQANAGCPAPAIAFRHALWEPLLALYHRRLRPQVDAKLAERRLRMQGLLDECGALGVALPTDWPSINQANTPADLSAALAAARLPKPVCPGPGGEA